MAVLPAVTPIMRNRSRRLGESTTESLSIPTSNVKNGSRLGAIGPWRTLALLSHEARPQSRRGAAGRTLVPVRKHDGTAPKRTLPGAHPVESTRASRLPQSRFYIILITLQRA